MEDFNAILMRIYKDGVEIINKLSEEELDNIFGGN
jgi:hypothetical protein